MTYDLEQLQLVTIEILLRRWLLLGGGRIFGADLRIVSENCEDKFRAEQGSASRTLFEQGALHCEQFILAKRSSGVDQVRAYAWRS